MIDDLENSDPGLDRRQFLTVCSAAGLANTLLPGALLALASQPAEAQAGSAGDKPATPKITRRCWTPPPQSRVSR